MNLIFLALSAGLFILIIWASIRYKRKRASAPEISVQKAHKLLMKQVRFYRALDREEQADFRIRAKDFLDRVHITPVGKVKLKVLDRIYVACAAIIPIFRFKGWKYNNLNEVLIYPGNFSKDFANRPADSNVMGMVGDGAMHRMMILSQGALRTGFEQAGRGNTAIHEFVHLLDKADGAVDGVPEAMLPDELTKEWMHYMYETIKDIKSGDTDINPYAATSEAEFFAVLSEYFFQRPDDLREKQPELWRLLETIYGAAPPNATTPEEETATSSTA